MHNTSMPAFFKNIPAIGTIIFIICLSLSPYLAGYVGITPHVGTNDLTDLQIPLRKAMQEYLARGEVPLWDQRISAGFPLFAEGQMGFFHPLNLFFASLPIPFYLSTTWSVVTAICLSGVGMFLFLQQIQKRFMTEESRAISAFGAVIWALNGFHLQHIAHLNILNVVSMLPFQLYFIEKLRTSESTSHRIFLSSLLGFTIALQVLAGHPQMTAYSLMYMSLYWFLNSILEKINFKKFTTQALCIGLSLLIGFTLGAIQLIPTLEFSANSTRTGGLTDEAANFLSLRIKDLPTFLMPFYDWSPEPRSLARLGEIGWPFDERYSYTGLLPLLLALIALPFVIKNRITLTTTFLGIGFLLLSLGGQTPLGFLLRIPPLNMFRVPAKFTLFFQLMIAILAVFAIIILYKKIAKNRIKPLFFVITILFLIDAIPKLYTMYPLVKGEEWYATPRLVQHYKQLTKDETNLPLKHRVIGQNFNVQLQKQYFNPDTTIWNTRQKELFKNNREHIHNLNMLTYDMPLLTNAINSMGLKVKWYSDIENILFFETYDSSGQYKDLYWKATQLAGARYLIHDTNIKDLNVAQLKEVSFSLPQDRMGLYEITESSNQFITLTTNIKKVPAAEDTLQETLKSLPKQVILTDDVDIASSSTPIASSMTYQNHSQTKLRIEIKDITQNAIILLKQSYYPGWVFRVNEIEKPVLRANHAFQAIPITTPGSQIVEVLYKPQSFTIGKYISLASGSIVVLLIILTWLKSIFRAS